MQKKEFAVMEVLQVLKKRMASIALITIIFTGVSAYINLFAAFPYYKADTKLFIGKKNAEDQIYNSNDIDLYQKLLKTYSEIILTDDLIDNALKNSNINASSKDIMNNLAVIPGDETQILEISYVSYDPKEAKDVVVAVTKEFISQGSSLIPNVNIKVIESAKLPEDPIGPRKGINIIVSAFIGLILSVTIIIFINYVDNSVNNKEQVEDKFKIPVIGEISLEKKKEKKKKFVIETNGKSAAVEAYRMIRTKIQYMSKTNNFKTIIITSAEPAEGKSTIAVNLALSFAKIGKKILLMECNLRKPVLQTYFEVNNNEGLVDILNEKAELGRVLINYNQNFKILLAGNVSGNPSDIFESKKMNELLEALKKQYDLIIMDTAPVEFFTDTQILAEKTDGTVVVSRMYKSNFQILNKSVEILSNVGANVIGIVLNGVKNEKRNKKYYS